MLIQREGETEATYECKSFLATSNKPAELMGKHILNDGRLKISSTLMGQWGLTGYQHLTSTSGTERCHWP